MKERIKQFFRRNSHQSNDIKEIMELKEVIIILCSLLFFSCNIR